ncbi:hypothetical protein [Aeromicrobium marinum]|uniref:hypothetical protein n=1 Tax=Aeromicrobium marinum TaxID=219314 RepID=UPI00058DB7A1|nr:hypothetical protein [Aeromicrobium marinum]
MDSRPTLDVDATPSAPQGSDGVTAPTTVTVVVGPRTRLGAAVAARAAAAGSAVHLLARDRAEAGELAVGGSSVVVAGDTLDLPAGAALRVVVCALGPVHPGSPAVADVSDAVRRDVDTVQRLIDAAHGSPVHVVLVSSIIAVAPDESRRSYGGWKAVVEAELRRIVGQHPGAGLSVVYPGRISDSTGRSLLHTTYTRLAAAIDALLDGPPTSRVAGLDARLWLLVHGLVVAAGSLFPGRAVRRGHDRSLPDSTSERRPA